MVTMMDSIIMPRISLFKYQQEAVNALKPGAVLCGGVGSGKSITALAYYVQKESGPLYIITTARKRDSKEWDVELERFGISAVIDSWNNIQKYVSVKGGFFIFDEQRVVGSGEWAKSFIKISKSNRWILLSATPGDTWMDYVPVFIANGFYKNRSEFIREHVIYSRFAKYPKIESYRNVSKLINLRRQVLVAMDYKKQNTFISKKIYVNFNKELYNKAQTLRWNIYEENPMQDAGELCRVLRKIVNSDKSRLDALLDIHKNNPKFILFYSFNYELEMIKNFLKTHGIIFSEWNGHKHESLPKGDSWIYLVQYSAGAEGWNCIETDTIVFYSQHYSYKIMTQAAGRIDRLNTPYKILKSYTLFSKSSIDMSIARALENKSDFNEKIFASSQNKHSI